MIVVRHGRQLLRKYSKEVLGMFSQTVQAIDEAVAKIIRNVTSSKFWINLVPVLIGALTVIESGGNWIQAVIGALMVVSGAGNYTYSKLRQNIEYMRTNSTKQYTVPSTAVVPTTNHIAPVDIGEHVEEVYTGIDWEKFLADVDKKKAEIKSVPDTVDAFARYSALLSVGRDYQVNDIRDVQIYADMIYTATLDWWKEVAGFDYIEALNKGVPEQFRGPCRNPDLNMWIRVNNPITMKRIVSEIKLAIDKVNKAYLADNSVLNKYLDWQRNLAYVWSTL